MLRALSWLSLALVLGARHGVFSFVAQRGVGGAATRARAVRLWGSAGGGELPQAQSEQARARAAVATAARLVLVVSSSVGALAARAAADEGLLTRSDVGMINLNETLPEVTNVCWLDVSVGDTPPQRIEISVFGKVTPQTAANFVALARGTPGFGYKGSDFFRVISTFSVQGGNINANPDSIKQSLLGKEGRSASGEPFAPENFRILHGYKDAGVVSMMKDIANKGLQDSRFFITTSPDASWADDRYSAFGVVSKGMDFVRGLSILPTTPPTNYPNTRIRIVDAGVY